MSPRSWQIGDRIRNRYEIRQVLGGPGKSGMGIVYVCYDREAKLPVALKTLQDRLLSSKAAVDRFKWEAETWTRLDKHQNIVRAFWVEMIEGRPYVVLEYVAGDKRYGSDLSAWIWRGGLKRNGNPDIRLILNFALQFCHGMMHAKTKFREMGRPFVHRDVKPSNIMITQDRIVKVTDFGLVKCFAESADDAPPMTIDTERLGFSKSGGVYGTPPYMSPEQCRGEDDIDERSDIYSLGCVLHEMLTGRYVFEAKTPEGFLEAHLNLRPRSTKVHPQLDEVMLKCLEKNRTERWQGFDNMEKVLSQLYRDLTGEMMRPPDEVSLAAWEMSNKGNSLRDLGFLDEAIVCHHDALKIAPNSAPAHNNLGIAYFDKGQHDAAMREFREALRIDPSDALAHANLGNSYRGKGQLDAAIQQFESALKIDPNDVQTHNSLAAAYGQTWRTDAAIGEFASALRIDPNNAEAHFGLGIAHAERGQLDVAIREFESVLRVNPNDARAQNALQLAQRQKMDSPKIRRQPAPKGTPDRAIELANMGVEYLAKEQIDAAIRASKEALRIDSNLALPHANLGRAYQKKGQLNAAIQEYLEALRIDPQDAVTHNNLANAYFAAGQIDAAIAECQEALKINPNLAHARGKLALIHEARGNIQEAVAVYRELVRLALPEDAHIVKQVEEKIRQLGKRLK
jgi:serine/threonine protein kinase